MLNLRQYQLNLSVQSTIHNGPGRHSSRQFLQIPAYLHDKEAIVLSSPSQKAAHELLPCAQGTLHEYTIVHIFYSVMTSQNFDSAKGQSPGAGAISDRVEQNQPRNSVPVDLSPARRRDHMESLLLIDLEQHRRNPDKLYPISLDLQTLAKEQKSEIAKLEGHNPAIEPSTISPSSSRQRTDESKSSQAKSLVGNGTGNFVVFSLSDNGLTIRQAQGMKGM